MANMSLSLLWHPYGSQLFCPNNKCDLKRIRSLFGILGWHHILKIRKRTSRYPMLSVWPLQTRKYKIIQVWIFQKPNSLFGTYAFTKWYNPLPEKLRVINNAAPNIKELWQFLGLTAYYKNHTNHYAGITHTQDYEEKTNPAFGHANITMSSQNSKRCLQRPPILSILRCLEIMLRCNIVLVHK